MLNRALLEKTVQPFGVTVDDKYMDETGKFHINDTGLVMYSHGEYFGFGDKLGSFGYSVRKNRK